MLENSAVPFTSALTVKTVCSEQAPRQQFSYQITYIIDVARNVNFFSQISQAAGPSGR